MKIPEELEDGDMEVLEHGSEPYPGFTFLTDMIYVFGVTMLVLDLQMLVFRFLGVYLP